MTMTTCILLMAALVLAALWTVTSTRLLLAAIGLAAASAVVAVALYLLGAPVAAVFELSVCAGLVPAIFISTIGLTRRLTSEELVQRRREKWRRFWPLPVLMILAGLALVHLKMPPLPAPTPPPANQTDVRTVMWNLRHVDLLGQVAILLGGAFAVVVLMKEVRRGR